MRSSSDKAEPFELEHHLVDGGRAHAEEGLHVGLGGGHPVERGVGVNEGEVLTLQGGVLGRPSGGARRSGLARHSGESTRRGAGSVDESPGERPGEGTRLGTVPVLDEAENIVSQGSDTLEAAVAEDAALKNAEPDLDLVDPGGVKRRVDGAPNEGPSPRLRVMLRRPREACRDSFFSRPEPSAGCRKHLARRRAPLAGHRGDPEGPRRTNLATWTPSAACRGLRAAGRGLRAACRGLRAAGRGFRAACRDVPSKRRDVGAACQPSIAETRGLRAGGRDVRAASRGSTSTTLALKAARRYQRAECHLSIADTLGGGEERLLSLPACPRSPSEGAATKETARRDKAGCRGECAECRGKGSEGRGKHATCRGKTGATRGDIPASRSPIAASRAE